MLERGHAAYVERNYVQADNHAKLVMFIRRVGAHSVCAICFSLSVDKSFK